MDARAFHDCWTELLEPATPNAGHVTETLVALYSSPESLPILIDTLATSPDRRIRSLAAFGLRDCINYTECTDRDVFRQLLALLHWETDSHMTSQLLIPTQDLFEAISGTWELIADFVADAVSAAPWRAILCLRCFVPGLGPKVVRQRLGHFAAAIDAALNSPDVLKCAADLIALDLSIWTCLNEGEESQSRWISEFQDQFTEFLINAISNPAATDVKRVFSYLSVELGLSYVRYSFGALLEPIVGLLRNEEFGADHRLSLASTLGDLLQKDSLPIDDQLIFELIGLAIELIAIATSDDSDDPTWTHVGDLLTGCFARLKADAIGTVVYSLFQELLGDSPIAALYLLIHAIERSSDSFVAHRNELLEVIFQGFQCDVETVRDLAAYTLCKHMKLFLPLFVDSPTEFIQEIMRTWPDERDTGHIILMVIKELPSTDAVFDFLLPRILAAIGGSQLEPLEAWTSLVILLRNSREAAATHFDEIWQTCRNHSQPESTVYEQAAVMQTTAQFPKTCNELLLPHLNEAVGLFMRHFDSHGDFDVRSCLNWFPKLFHRFPNELQQVSIGVIPHVLALCDSDYHTMFSEMFLNTNEKTLDRRRELAETIESALVFLAMLMRLYPEQFQQPEVVTSVCKSIRKAVGVIFTVIISGGCCLFRAFLNFIDGSDAKMTLIDTVRKILGDILAVLANERSEFEFMGELGLAVSDAVSIYGSQISDPIELIDICLTAMERTQSKHTEEFTFYAGMYQVFTSMICKILIDLENVDFMGEFMSRLMKFYEDQNCNVQKTALEVWSTVAAKADGFFEEALIQLVAVRAFESFESDCRPNAIDHLAFLIALSYRYESMLIELTPALLAAMLGALSELDPGNQMDCLYREALLCMICRLDTISAEPFVDHELLTAIIEYLPFTGQTHLNGHVYRWLAYKLMACQESPLAVPILRLICLPFCVENQLEFGIPPSLGMALLNTIRQMVPLVEAHQQDIFTDEEAGLAFTLHYENFLQQFVQGVA
jgi:hypothetical protein